MTDSEIELGQSVSVSVIKRCANCGEIRNQEGRCVNCGHEEENDDKT
jgi:transposase